METRGTHEGSRVSSFVGLVDANEIIIGLRGSINILGFEL